MIVERSNLKDVGKRIDTQMPANVTRHSNTTIYWLQVQFREMYTRTRPGFRSVLPANYDPFDQSKVIDYFSLKGIEYGNWLNQEDRYNYLMALQIAFFDLSIATGIKKPGLSKSVGVAFGARGKSKALAHFEPETNMINITRFKEAKRVVNPLTGRPVFGNKTTDMIKPILFEITGGMGSLAHEYGHALDYIFGGFIEPDQSGSYRSLTQGRSIATDFNIPVKGEMRIIATQIISKLIWEKQGEIYTSFFARIKKAIKEKKLPGGTYWIQHNELFARAFESYIQYSLSKKNISNTFLTKSKYDHWVYPDAELVKTIAPLFDQLLKSMAKHANK